MIKLTKSLQTWGSDLFNEALKQEILQLNTDLLPLQQGLRCSSYASDKDLKVIILNAVDGTDCIHAKTGVFYTGIVSGCHCADDPSPNNEQPEYCEILFEINKTTAETAIRLLSE